MIKNNYYAQHIPNIRELYSKALNGSLFNSVLRDQLKLIPSGESILENLELVWDLFAQLKNEKITTEEFIEKQSSLQGCNILESFKLSQIAYTYSATNQINKAKECLNESMKIDLNLYNNRLLPVMIAHYMQNIINHSRLYPGQDKRNSILAILIEQVLTILRAEDGNHYTTILADSFGVQALIKMDKEILFKNNSELLVEESLSSTYCTVLLLQLTKSIRQSNNVVSTKLFNEAVEKLDTNPQIAIFLHKIVA